MCCLIFCYLEICNAAEIILRVTFVLEREKQRNNKNIAELLGILFITHDLQWSNQAKST